MTLSELIVNFQAQLETHTLRTVTEKQLHHLLENSGISTTNDPQVVLELVKQLIAQDALARKQKRELLKLLISDAYLFNDIHNTPSDTVFIRVSALQLIELLIKNDNQLVGFLLSDQIDLTAQALISYLKKETDYRGYLFTRDNGWIQTLTHVAHTSTAIIRHPQVTAETKSALVDALLTKYTEHQIPFIYGEEEAFATSLAYLLQLYPELTAIVSTHLKAWSLPTTITSDVDLARLYNHKRFNSALALKQQTLTINE